MSDMRQVKRNYERYRLLAVSQLWDNAPKERKELACNYAYCQDLNWAVTVRNNVRGVNLTCNEIKTITRTRGYSFMPLSCEYPNCCYEDVNGTSRPGYSHTTFEGDVHVFIPFDGTVALKLVIDRKDCGKITGYFDETGRYMFCDAPSMEEAANCADDILWARTYMMIFQHTDDIPKTPCSIGCEISGHYE